MANIQQTRHHTLHYNAIWPEWSERHAEASVFEFFHTSLKKRHYWQNKGWDNDPTTTIVALLFIAHSHREHPQVKKAVSAQHGNEQRFEQYVHYWWPHETQE